MYIFLRKVHSYIFGRFIQFHSQHELHLNSLKRLAEELAYDGGHYLDSNYGYSGDVFFKELITAHNYKKQIDDGYPTSSESEKLYEHIIDVSSQLIREKNPPCFLNFGVSYAYTDSILADKFSTTMFYGIERTPAAQLYNKAFRGDVKNLQILAGDIFDALKNGQFEGGVFFHTRTLLLLPASFINKLYSAVYDAGFKRIVGVEQFGVSRQTGKPYCFSYEEQESVVYRAFMYIHNYPNILRKCGFELTRFESLKTGHPHEDFRFLSFEAERSE